MYHHATALIIGHNHPGGTLKPSEEDKKVTRAIQEALKTVDIALLDHIIIAGNEYFGFQEQGIL